MHYDYLSFSVYLFNFIGIKNLFTSCSLVTIYSHLFVKNVKPLPGWTKLIRWFNMSIFFLLWASFLKSLVPLFLSALVHQLAAFSNLILLLPLTCILVILLVTSVLNFLYSRCYVFIIILLYSLFLRSTFSTYFFFISCNYFL